MSGRTALVESFAGDSNPVEPPVGHVLISGCLPSGESAGRLARSRGAYPRTPAPGARSRAAGPTARPASLRPSCVDNNTRTSCPHFRRLWPRPMILRRDRGLAASPPVRYTLRVARRDGSPCLCLLLSAGTDQLLAERRRAACGDTRRRPRRTSRRLTDATAEPRGPSRVGKARRLVPRPDRGAPAAARTRRSRAAAARPESVAWYDGHRGACRRTGRVLISRGRPFPANRWFVDGIPSMDRRPGIPVPRMAGALMWRSRGES